MQKDRDQPKTYPPPWLYSLLIFFGLLYWVVQSESENQPDGITGSPLGKGRQIDVEPAFRSERRKDGLARHALHEAFQKLGEPKAARLFPRGDNAQRRFAEPVTFKLSEEASHAESLPMALSAADGRDFLLPEEVDLHTRSARRMVLDVAALEAVAGGRAARLLAPLPDGGALTLVIHSVTSRGGMTHTLQGEVEGEAQHSVVQLVLHDGIIHGTVSQYRSARHIEYRTLASGHLMVRELDDSTMTADCGAADAQMDGGGDDGASLPEAGARAMSGAPGMSTVDIVVGYDKGARAADGGHAQIEARIIAAVDRMNLAFANSLVSQAELMLLGVIEDPFYVFPGRMSGNMGSNDELGDLDDTSPSNPWLNTVSDYAALLGADLKAFVVKQADGNAGIARLPGTSSIVARDYMTPLRLTFCHEVGHNFGARHAWGDTTADAQVDMHQRGWRLAPPGHPKVRTIMAYHWDWGAGHRIPYFSNPDVLYQGVRTGQVDGYDATDDAFSDPRFISGGYIGTLGQGYDGSNSLLGARNAHFLQVAAPERSAVNERSALALLTPGTGEALTAGEQHEITWAGTDYSGRVSLVLYKAGVEVSTVAEDLPGHLNRFVWQTPPGAVMGADYLLRLILNGAQHADSGWFSITGGVDTLTVSPQGGFVATRQPDGGITPAQTILTLGNTTSSALAWTAQSSQPWIQLGETSGSVEAGAEDELVVSFSAEAENLPPGAHEGVVTVVSGGISHERGVMLTILGVPDMQVEGPDGRLLTNGTDVLDFGSMLPGGRVLRRLSVRNTGATLIELDGFLLAGDDASFFTARYAGGRITRPGEVAYVDVTYMPARPGDHSAKLQIFSDHAAASPFAIDLSGQTWEMPGEIQLASTIHAQAGGGLRWPDSLVELAGGVLFGAGTPSTGRELWCSNGETFLVKDLYPGAAGSDPLHLTRLGDYVLFTAESPGCGRELWRTDGSAEGTLMILDIHSGPASSNPSQFLVSNGVAWFTATTLAHGTELWRTDGSPEGTVMVKDIQPGEAGSSPADLVEMGGVLFFSAATEDSGRELWRSDGTEAGTFRLADIRPGVSGSNPEQLTVIGDTLFFAANDGDSGIELWQSDGNNASRVHDIFTGISSSAPGSLVEMNGVLYFHASGNFYGRELWRSDGTVTGTWMVRDLFGGSGNGVSGPLYAHDGRLYFAGTAGLGHGGVELWSSDGTSEGTVLVANIAEHDTGAFPEDFHSFDGLLFFTAETEAGRELWKTDGTEAGTLMVKDIRPGLRSSFPSGFCEAGGLLYFAADDGSHGRELWRTDGSEDGTWRVFDINPNAVQSTSFGELRFVDDTLYFAANDGDNGAELWTSDGTAAGTKRLSSIYAGSGSSNPSGMTGMPGGLIFAATSSSSGNELYFLSTPNNGIRFVRDIFSGATGSFPEDFIHLNGQAYFSAVGSSLSGRELWRSDGTQAGTTMVRDIYPGVGTSSNPAHFIVFNEQLYFAATNDTAGRELWRSDGTQLGTVRVADMHPGPGSSSPTHLTIFADGFVFQAATPGYGTELWRSDGSEEGTRLVADIHAGEGSSAPGNFTVLNGMLFFTADDGVSGVELWKSDGTSDGTMRVKDIQAGEGSSSPASLVVLGNLLFFSADDGVAGRELWCSDGTESGTVRIKDIEPGAAGSMPVWLTVLDGFVYFRAETSDHGAELWRTDGTEEGTDIVADYFPGVDGSMPDKLTVAGVRLFFIATHPELGTQLVSLPGRPAPVVFTAQPHSQAVSETDEVVFRVAVTGTGPFDYQWRRDGEILSGETGSELRIVSAAKGDEGEYDVVVTNVVGDFPSQKAALEVVEGAPRIVQQPEDQILHSGSDLHLEVAALGRPPLRYQWRFNGKPIAGATQRTLSLWGAGLKQAGRYSVVVASESSLESRQAEVAFVVNQPVSLVIAEQARAVLKVASAGNGLTHTWTRSGSALPERVVVSADGRTLTLSKAEADDSGTYFCLVGAPGGEKPGGSTHLHVFDGPPLAEAQNMPDGVVGSFYQHQVSVGGGAAGAANSFKAAGLPPGVRIHAVTGLISGVPVRADTYTITLTAINKHGSVPMTETIEIKPWPVNLDGAWSALVARQEGLNQGVGGRLDFAIGRLGSVTGKLILGDVTHTLKSQVILDPGEEARPRLELLIPRKGAPPPQPMTLEVEMDTAAQVIVTEENGVAVSRLHAGEDEAPITGWRHAWHARDNPASGHAGFYTFALTPTTGLGDSDVPQGEGFGAFRLLPAGTAAVAGRVADGVAYTSSWPLGAEGRLGVFSVLYGKPVPGSLRGILEIGADSDTGPADNSLDGILDWSRPDRRPRGGLVYPAGFEALDLAAIGGHYTRPATHFDLAPGTGTLEMTFGAAGVEDSETKPDVQLVMDGKGVLKPGAPNDGKVSFKPDAAKAVFSGGITLDDPHWDKPAPARWPRKSAYQGVIIQRGGTYTGHGYFLLPQMPVTDPKTTPVLSGQVLVE